MVQGTWYGVHGTGCMVQGTSGPVDAHSVRTLSRSSNMAVHRQRLRATYP